MKIMTHLYTYIIKIIKTDVVMMIAIDWKRSTKMDGTQSGQDRDRWRRMIAKKVQLPKRRQ